jgi:hypothetical protein
MPARGVSVLRADEVKVAAAVSVLSLAIVTLLAIAAVCSGRCESFVEFLMPRVW